MAAEQISAVGLPQGTDLEQVDADYFQSRQLKKGAAGWVLLVGLGVAYVISGDYAGWNFGLAQGGWGGMFLATLLMATMYLCMCFSLAELSSMIPTAGGGYGFARSAFGPWGGFLTGTAILIEYAIAPAAIAVFIGAYCESLFGIGGWVIYLIFYVVFIAIHILGAGEALKLMFVITAIAALALAVFIVDDLVLWLPGPGTETGEDVEGFLYNLFADPDIIRLPPLLAPGGDLRRLAEESATTVEALAANAILGLLQSDPALEAAIAQAEAEVAEARARVGNLYINRSMIGAVGGIGEIVKATFDNKKA